MRQNPDKDVNELRSWLADEEVRSAIPDPAKVEHEEDLDIAYLLKSNHHPKGDVREYVIEPFLDVLKKHDIKRTRQLPLTRMVRAMLFWVGVPEELHPSDAMIGKIDREWRGHRTRRKRKVPAARQKRRG